MTGGEDREAKRVAFLRGLASRRPCRHAQLLGVKGCRPTSVDTPADAPTPWEAVAQREGLREVIGRRRAGLVRLPPGFPRLRFGDRQGGPGRCGAGEAGPRALRRAAVWQRNEATATRTASVAVGCGSARDGTVHVDHPCGCVCRDLRLAVLTVCAYPRRAVDHASIM